MSLLDDLIPLGEQGKQQEELKKPDLARDERVGVKQSQFSPETSLRDTENGQSIPVKERES